LDRGRSIRNICPSSDPQSNPSTETGVIGKKVLFPKREIE